ncbi:MAG: glycosyltransferase family 39 protein [Phycisphaerales bacterium]
MLALVGVAVYLPGLSAIPPVDRDESRFAQASRQMLESVTLPEVERDPDLHGGGLAVPRVAGTPRLKKPPLIYWLQAGSAWVFTGSDALRDAIWMYRVPSALAALIASIVTWRIARTMMSARAALLAGVMLAVCPMVVWDAHQARADQLLLACTTIAMGALWHIWRTRDADRIGWGAPMVLWIATGAGLMTKGVTPLIVLGAVIWLSVVARRWRWIWRTKPIVGVAIVALMVAPWVYAVAQQVGWSAYWSVIFDETAGRSAGVKEGHWGPPGYHTVLSAALFWPGSLLTLAAFGAAWAGAGILAPRNARPFFGSLASRWRERTIADDASAFLIAWIVPGWVFFELISTKLPHYTMPIYPALALVTARALDDWIAPTDAAKPARPPMVGALIWGLIGLAWVGTAPVAAAELLDGPVVPAIIGAVIAGLGVILAVRHIARNNLARAHTLAIASAVVFAITLLGAVLPNLNRVWVSPRLAEHLPPDAPVGAVGYHEDSLVFLTRGRLERLGNDAGPAWLDANPEGVLVVPVGVVDSLGPVEVIAQVSGLNYSNGDAVDLRIVRRRDD